MTESSSQEAARRWCARGGGHRCRGWVLAFFLGTCAGVAATQEPPSRPSTSLPRLTLGGGSGTPGGRLVVPIYFTRAEGLDVGQLRAEIRFVSRNLRFSRLERGSAAASAGVELRHQYEERKDEQGLERALLTLVATVGEAADGGGIPGGLLAYLTFQVADKAGPANITLHTTAEATEQGSGRPLPEVEVVSELVEILAAGSEPLVSCFFFTH